MRFLRKAFTDSSSTIFLCVNDFLAVVTVVSVVVVVLETVPSLQQYQTFFTILEWLAVGFFSLEYAGRTVVSKPLGAYNASFFGLIDLVAIVPTILGLGNYTFLKTARTIRLIRLLRIIRLAKLKQLRSHDVDTNSSYVWLNISLFLVVLCTSVLLVGTVMYAVEGEAEAFKSIPLSMLWSFKVFLIGIPVAYPETVLGEVGHIIARVVGLLVFGVLINVAGNVVREYLFKSSKK